MKSIVLRSFPVCKKVIGIMLVVLFVFGMVVTACAGNHADLTVEKKASCHVAWSEGLGYTSLEYVTQKKTEAHDDTVILAIDGSFWSPDNSIVKQECLDEYEILYVSSDKGNGAEVSRNIKYARIVVDLLEEEFPEARKVVLYAFSKGGWYIDKVYVALKERGYDVLLYWCSDACPSQRPSPLPEDHVDVLKGRDGKIIYSRCSLIPNGLGYTHLEEDKVPIYVAVSKQTRRVIAEVTAEYGTEYCEKFGGVLMGYYEYPDANHEQLEASSAETFSQVLNQLDETYKNN